ncbi:hypothetical protein ABW20_dc0108818 [Dactylellina cionopaga]|nr:hypothetical protein ABW20_dc0108818 [Dactylellina cionopaga]
MPITWSSENYVKLLAAVLAAHPEFKPDYRNIAVYFGEGATYDAIQGCMRPIKKKALQLRQEVETGVRPNTTPKPTPKKRNAPGTASTSKGKKYFIQEDVDDEEFFTPTKKRSKMTNDGTPTPMKSSNKDGVGKAKGTTPELLVIDLLDSDEEEIKPDTVKIKSETKPVVVVKTESKTHDFYESEDDYYE